VLNKTAIRVFGTEGVLSWEGGQVGGDRLSIGKIGGELQTVEPAPGTITDWHVEEDFIDSIREGKPVTLVNFEDGLKYMEFTDAVWHSWNEGRAIDIRPVS
jgi:predicted dehydrogenase